MSETVDERDRTLGVHDSNKENEVWYLVVRVMVATGSGNSWLFDDCSIKEMFEVKKNDSGVQYSHLLDPLSLLL
jgi:hypothetical protein